MRLPIYGPYHAPHLYNDASIATILESLPRDTHSLPTPLIPVLSKSNEKLYNPSSFLQLLEGILQEILLKPLNWEKICEVCVADVQATGSERCHVVPVGLNNAGNSLVNALKQNGDFDVILDDRGSNTPAVSRGAPATVRLDADLEHSLYYPWCTTRSALNNH